MAESTDSFNLFAETTRDRSWSLPDEGARELKRTSGVITPDAKEFCTKKYNSYKPEDYSSDEDPAGRREKRKTAPPSSVSSVSISRSLNQDTPATDTMVDVSQRVNALPTAIADTTTVTTHSSNTSSASTAQNTITPVTATATTTAATTNINANITKDMIAPVAISVYESQRLSTSSLATTSNIVDDTATKLTKDNTSLFEHIPHHDNSEQHDDNDETASCTSSTPTEIVDYDEPDAVSSSSHSVSTLDRVRQVADTIAAALRPKLFPVFHIRDFAYPDNDPRHKGIYPRPVSAYRSVTNLFSFDEQDNPLASNEPVDNSMLSFGSSGTSLSSSKDSNGNNTEDGHKDEYTGPAKAIHDFYAEDPKDVLFKAGEECWIDRQLSKGVLLTFKNGQRCHVRESYLEFTNHE